jgi:phosphatidylserine/phosphatidylglycerophosphate/cardiolipin synthase-like enzyme
LPEGAIDPEPGLSLVTSREGIRALVLESHGWALLKNPISSAARLTDLGLETLARLPRLPLPRGTPPPVKPAPGMDLQSWERWLDEYTGTRLEQGQLGLLVNGEQFYPRLEKAIETATNRISFESFIFDRDDVATDVGDLLKARSSQVQTKVLMDRMGSLAAGFSPPSTPMPDEFVPPPSITEYLREGSDVRVRHFLNPWLSTDHSKVYLVDDAAWLGGMNIGREYRVEWHDLMVEVTGPIVSSFDAGFVRHWAHEGPWGDAGYLAEWLMQARTIRTTNRLAGGPWIPIRRLPTRTLWKPFSAAVLKSIHNARNYIYVENSYLFDRRVIRALVRARFRGVDVRVIMPRVNDFKAGLRSNLVTANFLLKNRVRVFFYPGMTHVKALMVDDWSCVGSGNLNHLSLRLSQEENVATSDQDFAARLKRQLFDPDFAHSYELTEPIPVDWLDILADLAAENL